MRRVPIHIDFVLEEEDPNIPAEILLAFANLGAMLAREAYIEKAKGIPNHESKTRLLVAKLFQWIGSKPLYIDSYDHLYVDYELIVKAAYALGIVNAEQLAMCVPPAEVLSFPVKPNTE